MEEYEGAEDMPWFRRPAVGLSSMAGRAASASLSEAWALQGALCDMVHSLARQDELRPGRLSTAEVVEHKRSDWGSFNCRDVPDQGCMNG
jgi:hypothetical protein